MHIENPSDVGRLFVFPPMKAGKTLSTEEFQLGRKTF